MSSSSSRITEENSPLAVRRRRSGIKQSDLAKSVGISRQFLSMLESGRVQPNVQVALRLATLLSCTVEELFAQEEDISAELEVTLCPASLEVGARVDLVRINDVWIAHPADTPDSIGGGFSQADGVIAATGKTPSAICERPLKELEGNVVIAGCDPALRLLCDARLDVPGRTVWINRGSGEALRMLLEGCVHVAGLHYGLDDGDENLRVVRQVDPQGKLFIMRFSSWEQGWILGPGVPDAFTGIADLAAGTLRLANRESGAAVRRWLDTELIKTGTLPDSICGYASVHHSHFEAVDSINAGRADVMLGPRSIATVFKLRFIPIGRVAFDLVFDRSLLGNARLDASIKWLAGRQFQQQMASLPGYLLR